MKEYPSGAIKGAPGVKGFGERLRCVREMRRITHDALAEKLDTTSALIAHYEAGHRLPGCGALRELCLALNVSADYLLDSH